MCIGPYFLLLQAFFSLTNYWLQKIQEGKKLSFFLESIIRLFFGFMIVSFIAVPCYYVLLAMEYQIAYEHPGELISTIGFVALAALVYYLWGNGRSCYGAHLPIKSNNSPIKATKSNDCD